jgi:hypothetical protein
MLTGGPSQLETWDPKPDVPESIRGPFRAIQTNVPGIRISQHFPLMAQRADRYAIIRSVFHNEAPIHETGQDLLTACGRTREIPVRTLMSGLNSFGQNCLLARHLVEQGVRLVTVNMFDALFNQVTWDCHANGSDLNSTLDDYRTTLCPMFDMAFTALLDDLAETGLLDQILVVATGEFGRSPRLNPRGGRDHWPGVWSVLMAGGGVRGGQVIGSSDAHAEAPRDRPVHASQIAATVSHVLGIDSRAEPVWDLF